MKNINNAEMLNMEQLDNVSGGTRDELYELIGGLEKAVKVPGITSTMISVLNKIPIFGTGSVSIGNNAIAPLVESILKKSYGIESTIRIGVLGSGWGEKGNTYSDNFGSLTHQQVLGIINKTFARTI